MKKLATIWQEILVMVILLGSLALVFPKIQSAFMTNMLVPCITTLIAFTVIGLVLLVFREQATDEREELHRYMASRYGYLLGSVTLLIGIMVQSWSNHFDPWLVFTLLVMIFTKIAVRVYAAWKH